MQQSDATPNGKELLDKIAARGMTDTEICNRAKALKMKLSRWTLWRIRTDRLKGKPYQSTLSKLAVIYVDTQP